MFFYGKINVFVESFFIFREHMTVMGELKNIFSREELRALFPAGRDNDFFESLLGDVDEGAFDIGLAFKGHEGDHLHFEFQLRERPGKCLACNLTYGLPQVFKRHPVINVNGLVREIEKRLDGHYRCDSWELGSTRELSRQLHVIPLKVSLLNQNG